MLQLALMMIGMPCRGPRVLPAARSCPASRLSLPAGQLELFESLCGTCYHVSGLERGIDKTPTRDIAAFEQEVETFCVDGEHVHRHVAVDNHHSAACLAVVGTYLADEVKAGELWEMVDEDNGLIPVFSGAWSAWGWGRVGVVWVCKQLKDGVSMNSAELSGRTIWTKKGRGEGIEDGYKKNQRPINNVCRREQDSSS